MPGSSVTATAFCSYEWTSMPNNMNLHRNILFKDCAKVPAMPSFILGSPDGMPWVMQAYSQIVDPNLTYADLHTIRAVNGLGSDDLENTYDA
jgi:Protein of unknown function (DUF3604)